MHPSVSRRLGIRLSAALLSALLLAGCADALVDVDEAAPDAVTEAAPLPLRLDAGSDPYVCVLSQRLADGTYATARYVPTFTEAAIAAAGGQTTTFTYRLRARDGTVRRHAACTVPASKPALDAIAAELRQSAGASGGDWHEAGTGGARTHQDEIICDDFVSGSSWPCEMEEIEVTPGRDWPDDTPPWPDGGGGGGEGGGDSGGGGGGGSGGSESMPVGKAVKAVRKVIDLVRKGEDLWDWRTWKKAGLEEWKELAECAADIGSTVANPDLLSIIGIIDCAAGQTAGIDIGDLSWGLRNAGVLDDLAGWLAKSSRFWEPLKSMAGVNALQKMGVWGDVMGALRGTARFGDYVNDINDLDVLYHVASLDKRGSNYFLLEGSAGDVFQNFYDRWPGRTSYPDGRQVITNGRNTMTLYPSSRTPYPSIEIFGPFGSSTTSRKVRFGRW